jgi:hypothetical protein
LHSFATHETREGFIFFSRSTVFYSFGYIFLKKKRKEKEDKAFGYAAGSLNQFGLSQLFSSSSKIREKSKTSQVDFVYKNS